MALWSLVFPPKCLACRKLLSDSEVHFCTACKQSLPKPLPKRNNIPDLDGCVSLWPYDGPIRRALLTYKFSSCPSMARSLGALLAEKVRAEQIEFDVLTWVPVSLPRLFRRGYDQDRLLALYLGKALGIKPRRLLYKVRHNPAQSSLTGPAQRRANVLGAYRVCDPKHIPGQRILLVDDIVTTGSTLSECARTLRSAGADSVLGLSIAGGASKKQSIDVGESP